MFDNLVKFIVGRKDRKELKRIRKIVDKINAMEGEICAIPDDKFVFETGKLLDRLEKGETLDDILPRAFALVREASKRITGRRHYDVQLIGGIALHEGKIAEMATGEGKTLVAALPAYLNALTRKGVHIVTTNDYLAERDAQDIGRIYNYLGLSTGVILQGMPSDVRRHMYSCAITYGTNHEFGFDYLKDNTVLRKEDKVQRGLNYCIIDEIDSILIDEARTPLILSCAGAETDEKYGCFAAVARAMKKDVHYKVDEKRNQVLITDDGFVFAETMLGMPGVYTREYSGEFNVCLCAAVKAEALMHKDKDYVVIDGKAVIVDSFTGRLMYGRRYNEGLHQAIEAKEGLKVNEETETLASITLQKYFMLYGKCSGMTGTAKTEENEFNSIYNLDVLPVPTNRPLARKELPDLIFLTKKAKYAALGAAVSERYSKGQPVLIGTPDISTSEEVSKVLVGLGIPHNVLNAKNHKREAEIVALAGEKGAVTVATNMAGRGTDISLGEGVAELGGLCVLGVGRNESRRIDNQLKGRSSRQGDPGESRFFVSLEDDLVKLYGGQLSAIFPRYLEAHGLPEDAGVTSKTISKYIVKAQKEEESIHFNARRMLLGFDEVMSFQRSLIYGEREKVLDGKFGRAEVMALAGELLDSLFAEYLPDSVYPEDWDMDAFVVALHEAFGSEVHFDVDELKDILPKDLKGHILGKFQDFYADKEAGAGCDAMRSCESRSFLMVLDREWVGHLTEIELLRKGIVLRVYEQKDPVQEFKFEAYNLFEDMRKRVIRKFISYIFMVPVE